VRIALFYRTAPSRPLPLARAAARITAPLPLEMSLPMRATAVEESSCFFSPFREKNKQKRVSRDRCIVEIPIARGSLVSLSLSLPLPFFIAVAMLEKQVYHGHCSYLSRARARNNKSIKSVRKSRRTSTRRG
jgi:delta-aminolevulinic acid dehydratase/porphobilinogen synthase